MRILCYGDSNTWGWVPSSMGTKRYSGRWPVVLQRLLGDKYTVIEEGLGGRTTSFDDPRSEFPERNGLKTLPIILETHLPLDLVIIMLGTTDTKEMLNLSSEKIAEGMSSLVKVTKKYRTLTGTSSPQILIIVPPIVKEDCEIASKLFKGGTLKGKKLVELYERVAKEEGVLYLDPTTNIKVDDKEGIHIDEQNHERLAKLIYEKIMTGENSVSRRK